MGHGGTLMCWCGYSVELLLGIGRLGCGIFDLPKRDHAEYGLASFIRNSGERKLVKLLLDEKHGEAVHYGYGAYRCPKCGTFHSKFHYLLKHDGGEHEPEYKCRKCRSVLAYLGDGMEEDDNALMDFSKYPCPECGKPELLMLNSIMWD